MTRDPDHRFLRHLCFQFKKLPDDPFFEEMDTFTKLWFYEGWIHELELEFEKERAHAILIGSFTNPEQARSMIKKDKPDIVSSDEDFEKLSQEIHEQIVKEETGKKRKKKRTVVKRG